MAADPTTMQQASGPGTKREEDQKEALKDTFPASDPVGHDGGRGSRAVPPEMEEDNPAPLADGKTLSYAFDDHEKAKLAGEGVVRAGLAERSRLSVDGSSLRLEVTQGAAGDADRMLQQAGGRAS